MKFPDCKKIIISLLALIIISAPAAIAQESIENRLPPEITLPFIDITVSEAANNEEVAFSLQVLLLLTVLAISPSIVLMTTCFLRLALVLDFVRRALSLQQVPPTQVLMGIALFLTLFIMWPVIDEIYQQAFTPFAAGEIGFAELFDRTLLPLRIFMFRQMDNNYDNIRLFMNMAALSQPESAADVPSYILVPAYILNELTIAFKMGIYLFIPFIIIDMVTASTLMSMGMIMLPPIMISLPFKLILFVLVDGWNLLIRQLVISFQ